MPPSGVCPHCPGATSPRVVSQGPQLELYTAAGMASPVFRHPNPIAGQQAAEETGGPSQPGSASRMPGAGGVTAVPCSLWFCQQLPFPPGSWGAQGRQFWAFAFVVLTFLGENLEKERGSDSKAISPLGFLHPTHRYTHIHTPPILRVVSMHAVTYALMHTLACTPASAHPCARAVTRT